MAPPGLPSSHRWGEEEPELASPRHSCREPRMHWRMGPACTPGRCPPRTPTPPHCERLTAPATGKRGACRQGGPSAKPAEVLQDPKCHVPSRGRRGGLGSPPADPTQHVCPGAKPLAALLSSVPVPARLSPVVSEPIKIFPRERQP